MTLFMDLKKVILKIFYLHKPRSRLIFNNILYKQIDRVALGCPLESSLANAFLAYHEQNWLDQCPLEYRPL